MELNELFYQNYWWFLISLLGALLVFLLFVQGGQSLLAVMGKTETEKSMMVNSLGRKWEFTFTTLVVFGGAFFASFPLFYSTSFGGAYWLWMAILFSFHTSRIIRIPFKEREFPREKDLRHLSFNQWYRRSRIIRYSRRLVFHRIGLYRRQRELDNHRLSGYQQLDKRLARAGSYSRCP